MNLPKIDGSKLPSNQIVKPNTSMHIRRSVEELGKYFRREFNYDQRPFFANDKNEKYLAYVWTTVAYSNRTHKLETILIGACGFDWKSYSDAPSE
ncbi:hypothetical protein [Viridibacillus arvi]|uniref:hypothetical protein n=1 Tax=Viridibacillus arvi TaxID=263475 RepID=UPI0034CEC5AC